MPLSLPEILYEDNHCLAIAKPAGCLSTHFAGKEETLDRIVKAYLKKKYRKPGNVFLGIVHRLDRVVSGVLLFARTSKAAARLAEQFRQGKVIKEYWAIVDNKVKEYYGFLDDWLKKDQESGRVMVVVPGTPGARRALLAYRKMACRADSSWLEIRPETGRTHQIRVQLAHMGHPIYGDIRYGSSHSFHKVIALHARRLIFIHPVRHQPISLVAPLPEFWRANFEPMLRENLK